MAKVKCKNCDNTFEYTHESREFCTEACYIQDEWNEKRVKLEEGVVSACRELVKHAGCNRIKIPSDDNFQVSVIGRTGLAE